MILNTQNIFKDSNTNWKYITVVVIFGLLVGGGILGFQYRLVQGQKEGLLQIKFPERNTQGEEEISKDDYYGSSTFGSCGQDTDCYSTGCNGEICQSRSEEGHYSICITPPEPKPDELGYSSSCIELKCQWAK